MKKLLILLTFLLLIPFTASAEISSEKPVLQSPREGFYGYAWLTDLPTVQEDNILQLVAENKPEDIYFSETDSTKDTNVFFLFKEDKLIGGVFQYKNESDYLEAHQGLISLFGKPNGKSTKSGNTTWSFEHTLIISDKTAKEPSISYYYVVDPAASTPTKDPFPY